MRWRAWIVGALIAAALPGCRSSPDAVELRVFAASSLTDAFGELEKDFEAAHAGSDVVLTFAGSQILRLQIERGAPADVFASANPAHVEALERQGSLQGPERFAQNELALVVPRSNPAHIESLGDLPRAERLVVGTAEVPVGRYTKELLRAAANEFGDDFPARVRERVVSEESNVRLVLAKVELGEADAAVVYRTDAARSEQVVVVPIPETLNVRADYVAGVVAASSRAEWGRKWIEFLRSEAGQRVLVEHGFLGLPD